jgi:cobyric acid synthase CobQ
MFQGTSSGVGKSILAAALCRALRNRGIKVAPFKAQNMALNSFVTPDGREMGRAQVFQAEACGLAPDCRMNPILLKPTADAKSQVIIMGHPAADLEARGYYRRSERHFSVVKEAYDSLSSEYEIMVIEGAGSPAEIILQDTDIVNMRMARHADAAVLIVGDIDKGGVFAALKGTYDLLRAEDQPLVKGFLINKFRGDPSLLEPAFDLFKGFSQVPILGVLPWFSHIETDEEDGVFVDKIERVPDRPDRVTIGVIALGRISNFTDFAPLCAEQDVEMRLVSRPGQLEGCDLVIIPGTKATTSDLEAMRETGLFSAILEARKRGVVIIGICGGFQMLGLGISDPLGTDGRPGNYRGLGLLEVETEMEGRKFLHLTETKISWPELLGSQEPMHVSGYEIHMGRTTFCQRGPQGQSPSGEEEERGKRRLEQIEKGTLSRSYLLGALSEDGLVMGTYLHGIFENDEFRWHLLNAIRERKGLSAITKRPSYKEARQENLDRLARWFEDAVDVEHLMKMAGL